ncbi:MAG TPA: c-type cytochrome [Steroidobacteraceae bacterium]|nr:c-type cytochrome [Steroidobacteraceae bacterium]
MRLAVLAVTALLGGFPLLTLAAPDPKVVQGCEDCHGANGITTAQTVPTIAHISASVQSDALKAFKAKSRPCVKVNYTRGDTKREGDMCSVAKDLSDAQIADLAAYYAAKPYHALKQPADSAKAASGKAIHERDCKDCHSAGGTDPSDDAGILGGQPVGWLKRVLGSLKKGEIDQPKKMKAVVSKLSDSDIEALANYYASEQ